MSSRNRVNGKTQSEEICQLEQWKHKNCIFFETAAQYQPFDKSEVIH